MDLSDDILIHPKLWITYAERTNISILLLPSTQILDHFRDKKTGFCTYNTI